MDEMDQRIKQHLQEHLKFDVHYDKGIEYRVYLEYMEEKKETQSTISSGFVAFDDLLDVDTADNNYVKKDYLYENYNQKE